MLYAFNILVATLIGVYSTQRWRRLGFRLTSPAGLAAFVWCVVWAVHLSDVFGYFEVSTRAQLYSLLPVVFLFVGEQAAQRLRARPYAACTDRERLGRLVTVNALVAVAFGVATLVSVFIVFGNPLAEGIGEQIKNARSTIGAAMLSGSPLFVIAQYAFAARAFVYVCFLVLAYVWAHDRKRALKLGVATVGATLLMDVAWASRSTILDMAIFLVAAIAISRRKPAVGRGGRRRSGPLTLAIVAAAFATLVFVANSITQSTRPDRTAEIAGVPVPVAAYQLAVWYTSPLVTFDQTLDANTTTTYGLMSGGGVLNVLYLLRLYRNDDLDVYEIMYEWETENPFYRAESYLDRGNIYSWLRYLYVDFGVVGFTAVPFLLGFLVGRTAKRASASPVPNIFAYAILAMGFYIAARSPLVMGTRQDYVVLAVCIVAVFHLATRRRARGALAASDAAAVGVNR